MSRKTKIAEMQRLRAAGLTLANASRLSQDKRGSGTAIAAASGVALVLIGGIVALSFELTRATQSTQSAAAGQPAVPIQIPTAAPDGMTLSNADLGEQTLSSLTQLRQAQSMLVTDEINEETTKAAGGASSAFSLTQPSETPSGAVARIVEAVASAQTDQIIAAAPKSAIDCTSALGHSLRAVSVPFALSSKTMSKTEAEILNRIVTDLNNCNTARLMINGHSDGTGEELANMQLS